MEDTWGSRDLPVLDAAVKLFQAQDFVYVDELAAATGYEVEDVAQALLDMRYEFVSEVQSMGSKDRWCITGVSPAARQAVGQWPTPEKVVDRLAVAFMAAAKHEPDAERRSKLRAVGGFMAETGRELAADVIAKVIGQHTGQG